MNLVADVIVADLHELVRVVRGGLVNMIATRYLLLSVQGLVVSSNPSDRHAHNVAELPTLPHFSDLGFWHEF